MYIISKQKGKTLKALSPYSNHVFTPSNIWDEMRTFTF